MPRKKTRVPKEGPVWHRSAEEATLDQMPKFNAHACRTGAHGDAKYNRAKQKRSWQREMEREGARNRGRLPFIVVLSRGVTMQDRYNSSFQFYWGFSPIAVSDSVYHALNQVMFHRREALTLTGCACAQLVAARIALRADFASENDKM